MAQAVSTEAVDGRERRDWRVLVRRGAIWLLVLLASLGAGVFIIFYWVEHQVLNADSWANLVGPLPKQDVVATALSGYITDRVYDQDAVQTRVAAALPEQAAFLAGPIAAQVQTLAGRVAMRVVQSDIFETIWTGANRAAMSRLVSQARGQVPSVQQRIDERFTINVSDAVAQLRDRLGTTSAALPALQPGATKAVQVTADLRMSAANVHQYIQTIDFLSAVLPLGVLAAFLWALALSYKRWQTVLGTALLLGVVILIALITVNWLRQNVVDQVQNAANVGAVSFVYDQVIHGLRSLLLWALLAAVVLAVLASLASPAPWAKSVQSLVRIDRLRASNVAHRVQGIRAWIRDREVYLILASVVVVLIVLVFTMPLNGQVAANAVSLFLILTALEHLLATPRLAVHA